MQSLFTMQRLDKTYNGELPIKSLQELQALKMQRISMNSKALELSDVYATF